MRFMVLMIPGDYKKMEAGAMPDEKLVHAMMAYNEELSKAGVLLALDGLHPTSKGARIRFSGGKGTVTDGPPAVRPPRATCSRSARSSRPRTSVPRSRAKKPR
jgi:hypothetical protein